MFLYEDICIRQINSIEATVSCSYRIQPYKCSIDCDLYFIFILSGVIMLVPLVNSDRSRVMHLSTILYIHIITDVE